MSAFGKFISPLPTHEQSEFARIVYFDGWRGLAICFVLCSHFLPISGINIGRLGVDIFFVLSGLLMSNILFVKRVPIRIFYKRRISRIFPVFFIFLSFFCAVEYLFYTSNEYKNFFYSLLFLRSYFPVDNFIWSAPIPIGHIWSLNVEEHCYVFLSIVAIIPIFKGKEYLPLIFFGSGSILLHCVYIKYPEISTKNYGLKTEIVASHLLLSAGYFLIKNKIKCYIPSWAPLISFLLSVFCYSTFAPWYFNFLLAPFLLAFTINHLDLAPKYILYFLTLDLLKYLGVLSYSIYLWQQPFYSIYKNNLEINRIDIPYLNLLLLFLSLILGAISFYFLEKPTREYLNNNW